MQTANMDTRTGFTLYTKITNNFFYPGFLQSSALWYCAVMW